jgi:hypothetical protein
MLGKNLTGQMTSASRQSARQKEEHCDAKRTAEVVEEPNLIVTVLHCDVVLRLAVCGIRISRNPGAFGQGRARVFGWHVTYPHQLGVLRSWVSIIFPCHTISMEL